jgi:hypothetical protein
MAAKMSDVPVFLPQDDLITWQRFIETDKYFDTSLKDCLMAGWPEEFVHD